MTRRDDATRLRHMLDHAREAVDLAAGRTREDLERDRVLELALVRLVELVGEASTQVNDPGQRCYDSTLAVAPWDAEQTGTRLRYGRS
jgi:uncharacterized protein with HEPN domain